MALKIRKGTNADRLLTTFALGELVYTTDTNQLFVGDGTTTGGVLIGPAGSAALSLGGDLTLNGYNIVGNGNIDINGTITATGDINLGNTDEDNIVIGGEINSNIIPNVDRSFNLGSQSKQWSNGFIDNIESSVITANSITGNVVGDVRGSVFADNSTMLVDGTNGRLVGPLFGDVTGDVLNGSLRTVDGETTYLYKPGEFSENSPAIFVGTVSGRLLGEVLGPDDSVIIDSNNFSVNLNGSVTTNIIPNENETFDIGSSDFRFKDLYLSGSTVYLGDLTLSKNNNDLIVSGPVKSKMPVNARVATAPIGLSTTDNVELLDVSGIRVGSTVRVPGLQDELIVDSVDSEDNIVVFTEEFLVPTSLVDNTELVFLNPESVTATIKTTAPSVQIGEPGDSTGMIAYDNTYMYICTGDYDGSTLIWKRTEWSVDAW